MTEHTSGPWTATATPTIDIDHIRYIYADLGENKPYAWIAKVKAHSALSQEENLANARLIAAAPDLLEQLRLAKQYLVCLIPEKFDDEEHQQQWATQLQTICAAIAKAEGNDSIQGG